MSTHGGPKPTARGEALRAQARVLCAQRAVERHEDAAAALRRRLDPADHLSARASLAAIEPGETWRVTGTAPLASTSVTGSSHSIVR